MQPSPSGIVHDASAVVVAEIRAVLVHRVAMQVICSHFIRFSCSISLIDAPIQPLLILILFFLSPSKYFHPIITMTRVDQGEGCFSRDDGGSYG
jgi:hypothetical protein